MMFSRKEEEDRQTKGWSASEWSGALDETLRAERGRHDDEAQARVAAAKQRTHEMKGQDSTRGALRTQKRRAMACHCQSEVSAGVRALHA